MGRVKSLLQLSVYLQLFLWRRRLWSLWEGLQTISSNRSVENFSLLSWSFGRPAVSSRAFVHNLYENQVANNNLRLMKPMDISATSQLPVSNDLYEPYSMGCNKNHKLNKFYFPLFSQTSIYLSYRYFIEGSRRARSLLCTPYLDFGGNFVLQKSIDKSS